jgi:hypothetical protein
MFAVILICSGPDFSQLFIFQIVFSWLAVQGHDTTASAMTWFLYCIAKHPEHQVYFSRNTYYNVFLMSIAIKFEWKKPKKG